MLIIDIRKRLEDESSSQGLRTLMIPMQLNQKQVVCIMKLLTVKYTSRPHCMQIIKIFFIYYLWAPRIQWYFVGKTFNLAETGIIPFWFLHKKSGNEHFEFGKTAIIPSSTLQVLIQHISLAHPATKVGARLWEQQQSDPMGFILLSKLQNAKIIC